MNTAIELLPIASCDEPTVAAPASLRLLFAHNDYGRPSGEEHAIESAAQLLTEQGHHVSWLRESSTRLMRPSLAHAKAFVSGIHSHTSRRRMIKTLDQDPYDLVHVQNLYPFLSPSILQPVRQRGIPLVMRCPNYRLFCPSGLHLSQGEVCQRCMGGKEWWCVAKNCEQNYLKSMGYALRSATARITRSIIDNVTLFVVLSEFQRKRFIAGGIPPERIGILHNFIDRQVHNQSESLGEAVSFLGRPSREKGIETFLSAARALPNVPFAVAGDPRSLPASVIDVPANVEFHGFLSGEALDAFCRNARMIVAPSTWYEGFPNVLVRAMKYGKPIVCSRIGALPEIVIDGKTGLLHDPHSTEQLIERIEQLYDDSQLCLELGARGKQRAETCYSREAFYEQLMRLYARAIELASGPSVL